MQGLELLEDDKTSESAKKADPDIDPKDAIDSDGAFQNLKEVKSLNYLVGMSMWVLTKEKKDELLKPRDHNQAELRALKSCVEKPYTISYLRRLGDGLNLRH